MVAARRENHARACQIARATALPRHARLLLTLALALPFAPRVAAATPPGGGSVSVAAAANFVHALDALNAAFKRSNPDVALVSATGSSGSLYAQIKHGAPFDIFLSADTEYPRQLVAGDLGAGSTLQVFARGRLVIWTARADLDLADFAAVIRSPSVRKIAIAQPRLAPYGRAARAALEHAGVWRDAESKLVFGDSIAQTGQFVETGNADVGLVALSLVLAPRFANQGRWQEVSPALHPSASLDHAAVLTTRGAANPAAQRYLRYLRSDAAKEVLRAFGYDVPESP